MWVVVKSHLFFINVYKTQGCSNCFGFDVLSKVNMQFHDVQQHVLLWMLPIMWSVTGCDGAQVKSVTPVKVGAGMRTQAPAVPHKNSRYRVDSTQAVVLAGEDARVFLTIKPGDPTLKINPEFPWKLMMDEPDAELGVALKTHRVDKAEVVFSAQKADFPIRLIATTPGVLTLTGRVDLSVCERAGKSRCFFARGEAVSLELKVNPRSPTQAGEATPNGVSSPSR